MIAFNPSDTLLFNIGVDVFACFVTVIIYFSYKKDFADTYDNMILRKMQAALFLVLVSDILMWVLNGKSGVAMRALGYMDNMAYFIMKTIVALYWLRYAWYRIYGRSLLRKQEIFIILVPFAVLSLLILSSALNGWIFYLDEANYYHRGILAAPLYFVVTAYPLLASGLALIQYRKETLFDRKRELQLIAFFAVPPVLGGIAQTLFYGFSLIWPLMAISCLLLLRDKSGRAISQDALTGLNNRRNLERHLGAYKENGQNRPVTLIMLDINDFKHINDQYGHESGDSALIHAANTLKEIFNGTSAFLARYGGDEFVVVLPESSKRKVENIVQKIRNSFESCGKINQSPFPFSVSVGYAISTEYPDSSLTNLLKKADETMYKDKALHHQKKHAREV